MKTKLITFIFANIFISALFAQGDKPSGLVIYEKTRKLEIKLSGDAAGMEKNLPKERKTYKEFWFTGEATLYRNAPEKKEDEVVQESSGGRMMMMRIQEPEEFIYTDLKAKQNTEQRDFMSRKFLIESKTDTVQWKLTGNQKTLLGYVCMEAELNGSDKKTLAWFTPMIPVSSGPDGYTGLPGLILYMDIDEGKTLIEAKSVEMKAVDAKIMVKPKEGKKVSVSEFRKIREDKMKEMNQGGGNIIIIRSN